MPNYISIGGKWVSANAVQTKTEAPPSAEVAIKEDIAAVEKVVKPAAPATKPKAAKKKSK